MIFRLPRPSHQSTLKHLLRYPTVFNVLILFFNFLLSISNKTDSKMATPAQQNMTAIATASIPVSNMVHALCDRDGPKTSSSNVLEVILGFYGNITFQNEASIESRTNLTIVFGPPSKHEGMLRARTQFPYKNLVLPRLFGWLFTPVKQLQVNGLQTLH